MSLFNQVSVGRNIPLNPQAADGHMGLRLFNYYNSPSGAGCTLFEDLQNIHLAATRWYLSLLQIFDGSLVYPDSLFIIGIKLEYLCRNKLPRVIFILMCECDHIISCIITGAGSLALIDGNCLKRCIQVVVGHSVKLKHSIVDQTIIDNCQIS